MNWTIKSMLMTGIMATASTLGLSADSAKAQGFGPGYGYGGHHRGHGPSHGPGIAPGRSVNIGIGVSQGGYNPGIQFGLGYQNVQGVGYRGPAAPTCQPTPPPPPVCGVGGVGIGGRPGPGYGYGHGHKGKGSSTSYYQETTRTYYQQNAGYGGPRSPRYGWPY